MSQPLVSVIIPVYNVAPYLARCVDSVLQQRYTRLEIILIDDGATDESGRMCDDYARKDARICVIHKPNGGLSDARNAGLDVMTGEYVTCIDSDDFVLPYYVENLVTALEQTGAALASSWFVNFYQDDPLPPFAPVAPGDIAALPREDYYRRMLYQDGVEVSAWGKLYRSDLFDGVRYPKGKIYEDIPTTYRLIEKVDTVAVIPCVDYCYFQRKDSIAQSAFHPRKMDGVLHMRELRAFITQHYPRLAKPAACRYFSTVCNILFLISSSEHEAQRQQLWSEVKQLRLGILLDRNGRKKARLAAGLSFAGYRVMKWVYHALQR